MGVGGELGTREVFDSAGNQQAKVHLTIDLISRLPFSELKPVHYKVAKQHNSGSSQVGPPEPRPLDYYFYLCFCMSTFKIMPCLINIEIG